MMRALYTAATGMRAEQTNVDTIANNLSNVNTTGFKGQRTEFKSLLYQTIQTRSTSGNGDAKPVGAQVGLGTRVAATPSPSPPGPLPPRPFSGGIIPKWCACADMVGKLCHQKTLSQFRRTCKNISAGVEQTVYHRRLALVLGVKQFIHGNCFEIEGV